MPDAVTSTGTTSVLFVCLGNICRSPMAEGIFRHLLAECDLAHRFHIDSAGTGAWHIGEPPDERATAVAARHGITLTGAARQLQVDDLHRFDHVVAMDRQNLEDIRALARSAGLTARVHLLRDFDPEADGAGARDVPDPYFGGAGGFEAVYRLIRRSCEALLEHLRDG